MDVRLDGHETQLIHHLDGGGHDAGRDDAAHRRCAVLDAGEVHQHRRDRRRILRQPHADRRRDPEHALAADEHAAEIETVGLGLLTAEHRHGAVGQHDLDSEHVARGDPVGEAVRTTRVVGNVAADRAGLLTAGIRSEVQAEVGESIRQIEVEHPRLHPGEPVDRVDRGDPVHLRGGDHHGTVQRNGTARQSGSRIRVGTNGTPWRLAICTQACTSAVVSGRQTTEADPDMLDESLRYSDSSVGPVFTRRGPSTCAEVGGEVVHAVTALPLSA